MASDLTPESVRQVQFRTTLRGLDRGEVELFLDSVATRLEALEEAREKLAAKLESANARDLETEFDSVGREVAAILQAAREASDTMRERAKVDSTKWRSEAMEEAEEARKSAAADAEALRRDAWVTGSQLLEQSAAAAETLRANAARDVLTIMGEAEREAHRLTSGARRESEDLVRNAAMEVEKITNEAVKRRDEIIDGANRQAATAQERARALEQRRDELLDELENVRSTLTRLESSLEERREALDLGTSEPSNVKVVHPPADAAKTWELGETVRVVPPKDFKPGTPDPGVAEEVADEVIRMREPPPEPQPAPGHEPAPEPEAETEVDTTPEPESEPAPTTPRPAPAMAEVRSDDLTALFSSLRESGSHSVDEPPVEEEAPSGIDWLDVRESKLLPITNRALRGIRKAITEIQNVALDSLRTESEWAPDRSQIVETVHAEILAVWSESFAAGHEAAEEMTRSKLKRPKTPKSSADDKFASDLANAVERALADAGATPKSRQSAVSRIFRTWRSDEAERRIREISLHGYEAGVEKSRSVTSEV